MANSEPQDSDISTSYAVAFMQNLAPQSHTSEFSDVTVVIDGCVEFKCHRIVLATCSGFFKALLSSGMREDLERRVDLKGISKQTFEEILKCMYNAKSIITKENLIDVWHAANQLEMLLLIKDCERFVEINIAADNCFAVYQTSKLLDSERIKNLSWKFILRWFDSVSNQEEILLLTGDEMKQLVADPDLVTSSEERVVDTILKWVMYKPRREVENIETDDDVSVDVTDTHPDADAVESTVTSNELSIQQETGDHLIEKDLRKGFKLQQHEQQQTQSRTVETGAELLRTDYLPELLKLSRICLLSGRYLMKHVLKNPVIKANKAALRVAQEALDYKVQGDRRHDCCLPSAIYRSLSELQNIIIALSSGDLIGMTQNDQWQALKRLANTPAAPYLAVCFQNNIYLAHSSADISVFISSINLWRALPKCASNATKIEALLSVGDFLYAVYSNSEANNIIEKLNIADSPDGQVQTCWLDVGNLSTPELDIVCSTVIDDKLIFLGHGQGQDDILIECFDTNTGSSSRHHDIQGPSSGMVTFKKDNHAFVLQRNGKLWRIKPASSSPSIEVKYETLLWDFYRELNGAVLFNDELLLFGTSLTSNSKHEQWELTVSGVFSRIKNVICDKMCKNFVHTVIPKQHLITTEDDIEDEDSE